MGESNEIAKQKKNMGALVGVCERRVRMNRECEFISDAKLTETPPEESSSSSHIDRNGLSAAYPLKNTHKRARKEQQRRR